MTDNLLADIYVTIHVSDNISESDSYNATPSLREKIIFTESYRSEAELGEVSDHFFLVDRIGALIKEVKVSETWRAGDISATINASLPVQDTIDTAELISFKQMDVFDKIYTNLFCYIKDKDISSAVETYFPDYFYQQEPYVDLIEALSSRASLNYIKADLINLVYNIDMVPQNYKTYNALLRLLGINYDFTGYPLPQLKQIIRNYLSIRKHRGTKNSLLAMLRTMDPLYLQNPETPCEMELEFVETDLVRTISNNRKGILYIFYGNIPPKYSAQAQYMLSKVVPTGLAYKLITKKVTVHDTWVLFDRAYPPENIGQTCFVGEVINFGDSIIYKQMTIPESIQIKDLRGEYRQDIEYISDHAQLCIKVGESMTVASLLSREAEVIDMMPMSDDQELMKDSDVIEREVGMTLDVQKTLIKLFSIVKVEEGTELSDTNYTIEIYEN